MLKMFTKEMRIPALAAAACAAAILVASPVSAAATVEEGRQAANDYRVAVLAECSTARQRFKAGCIGKIGKARQEAQKRYNDCLAEGGTKDECQGKVNDYWVELAG